MSDKLHKALMDEGPCLGSEDLMAYHDGRLEGDALRKVELHLAHCELCSEAYDGLLLSEVTPEELESDIAELNNRAWKRVEELSKPKSRRPILWMSAASVALIAIVGSWLWYAAVSSDKKMEKAFAEQFTLPSADSLLIASSEAATDSIVTEGSGVVFKTLADQSGPGTRDNDVAKEKPDVGYKSVDADVGYAEETEIVEFDKLKSLEEAPAQEDVSNEQLAISESQGYASSGVTTTTPTPSRSEKPASPKKSAENKKELEKGNADKSVYYRADDASSAPSAMYAPEERMGNSQNTYDAIALYDSVSAVVEPVRPAALVGGLGAYNAQDYRSAVKQFTEVLKVDPNHQEANFYAGVSYLGLQDAGKAIPCLERAVKGSNPTIVENAEWYLALAYVKEKDRSKAEPILRKIEAKPASPYKSRAADVLEDIKHP